MDKTDSQKLEALVKQELKIEREGELESQSFISLVDQSSFEEVKAEILGQGGEIIFADAKIGMISFKSPALVAKKMMDDSKFKQLILDNREEAKIPQFEAKKLNEDDKLAMPSNFYPTQMMGIDKLKAELKDEGVELDGSSATIAIFDTGLDIGRTDIFQDRIVELHTIRDTDFAKMTNAEVVEDNGVQYLHAVVDGIPLKIEKTGPLAEENNYLLGYFTEKQFAVKDYENYDFNQDGKDSGIFPVVAFKNAQGIYQVYVNVNSSLIYGEAGDDSIVDENLLMDFNYVSQNIENRYMNNMSNPIQSYYRYTTRLDVAKANSKNQLSFTKDRNKGLVNLAVLVRPGFELGEDGNLVNVAKQGEAPLYQIGLAGFDIGHHGTHCAGIAAGNFTGAKQFSSGASKAKIIGGTLLGTGYTYNDYFKMIQTVASNHKNVVFSFSFGSNTAINLLGGKTATFIDAVSKAYGVAFVKAAGNEGPGVNTHGAGTSQWTIDVANYYSSNSRNSHGVDGEYLGEDKVFVAASSSRGPMYDGALKPDIGAPGYVMSAIPMSIDMGGKSQAAFGYWPGTSMATPNAASVVALLYDAASKTGLTDNSSEINPFSVDKLHKAIKNSAIAYDKMITAECRSKMDNKGACELEKKEHKFAWIEGGAGRINALGAWEVLKEIKDDETLFVNTNVSNRLSNFEGYNFGFYSIDEVPASATFWVSLNKGNSMEEMTAIHSYRLVADADWISFSPNKNVKEKVIEIVPGTKPYVEIYFDRAKLLENGRVKGGVHTGLVKAFGLKNEKFFDWIFPVTIVGSDSRFDQVVDDSNFGARGFIPAGQFASYFFKVEEDQSALILDLQTSVANPGAVRMSIFKDGMEMNYRDFKYDSVWASSNNSYNIGRQHARYLLSDLTPGVYEVVVHADSSTAYDYQGEVGSYYELMANRVAAKLQNLSIQKGGEGAILTLKGLETDRYIKLSKTGVIVNKLIKNEVVEVKHQERLTQDIVIGDDVEALIIRTDYLGSVAETDADIALLNEEGQMVAQSAYEGSREAMYLSTDRGLKAGTYKLIIDGYAIPQGSAKLDLSIQLMMKTTAVLASEFTAQGVEKKIAAGGYLKANKVYDFVAKLDLSDLSKFALYAGYEPIYNAIIGVQFGNGEEAIILNRAVQ